MSGKYTLFTNLPATTFIVTSPNGQYTVYPRITKPLAEKVFAQTGLWLRFAEGEEEIRFIAGEGYFGGMCLAENEKL